jgi:hypothetical protein
MGSSQATAKRATEPRSKSDERFIEKDLRDSGREKVVNRPSPKGVASL